MKPWRFEVVSCYVCNIWPAEVQCYFNYISQAHYRFSQCSISFVPVCKIIEPWYYYRKTALCIPPVKGIRISLIIPTRVRYFGSELHRRHVIIIIKAITETINYLIWISHSYSCWEDWNYWNSSAVLEQPLSPADWSFLWWPAVSGKLTQSQSQWSFVGQTPAEPGLLLLKWLTCTSNLPGLHTARSLVHASWHRSLLLAPVIHQPSCEGSNSWLCFCWGGTARL